ncbi:MAG: sulfotransferase [Bacteroidia bacterium]|nr:sulfotransferase domain-containing protein [Bacteroidia bacterium]MCZ2278102.1 sulfotransferase [Bacteroidia bacterium]
MIRIAIHSVPRSGSTWLGELFNSNPRVVYRYQPLFSYQFKGRLNENSNLFEIEKFFEEISRSEDEFITQLQARKVGIMPVFKKDAEVAAIVYKEVRYHYILDNLLQQDQAIKVIGLVRNPLAVICSWLNAPKEFRKDKNWDEMEEWRAASRKNQDKREEFSGFEKWKEVTLLFEALERTYPAQFRLVHYSDLLSATGETIRSLFHFCGLDFSLSTQQFISDSRKIQNQNAYSVFKIKKSDDDWKGKLNPRIISEIEKDVRNTNFEKYCR